MARSLRTAAVCLSGLLTLQVVAGAQTRRDTPRDDWQRVADVVTALGLTTGSHVADVGAGDGYFTMHLSKAVGASGAVYAVDVSSQALARLRTRLEREEIRNVQVIEGAADDPRLPEGRLDAALIVNAYHEMTEHQAMLAAIRRALKPQGRLVIIEPITEARRGAAREAQQRAHEIAPEFVQADLTAAGFRVVRFEEGFTDRPSGDREWLMVASPAPAAPSAPADEAQAAPEETDWLNRRLRVEVADARRLFETGAAVFIDVRGIDMFEEGHITGARMIDMRGLKAAAPALAASGKRVITYCS